MERQSIKVEVVTEFDNYLPGEQINGLILVETTNQNDDAEIHLIFSGNELIGNKNENPKPKHTLYN